MKDVYISHAEYGIGKAMNFNFGTQIDMSSGVQGHVTS